MGSFKSLALSETMISSLARQGYLSPSPVQERVIPKALKGQSLVCQSETGSGKTHSFLIPIIDSIDFSKNNSLQAIIIAPSRELARQIYTFASAFIADFPSLKVRLFSSEMEKEQNEEGLSKAPHIVIGTPGRLGEVLDRDYSLDLHEVRTLVLDEADMLMEFGYFDEIDSLFDKLPERKQTMVFSATLNEGLTSKLSRYISSSFLYEGKDNKTATRVRHHLVDVKHAPIEDALIRFLKSRPIYLGLIFASKKEGANAAYAALKKAKLNAVLFTGDLEDRERKKTIKSIKENRYQYIVCSDLLARGIDIEDVSDVISLDLPSDSAYYYHRAGRTGRFDKEGDSWVFYNRDSLRRPKELLEAGVPFDYYELRGETLVPDELGLIEKKKFTIKKNWESEEQLKDIKIAKAKSRSKKVKPGYKKKTKEAIERVKGKYRRKAIKEAVKKNKEEGYRKQAARKAETQANKKNKRR
ncbi:MAG: DEAD/DEAH box helicase [Bacilli bacterium]|nr:DEAD/DEAH box helicase [Bacilli bacterium]